MTSDIGEGTEWEEEGEVQGPSSSGSAVQSVRFTLKDLQAVREAARRAGETTSEFIRGAALARAIGANRASLTLTYGSGAPSFEVGRPGTESTAPRVDIVA